METHEGMVERGINFSVIDHDFIETLGIEILEGRDFSENIKADTLKGVMINETLAKRMNWEKPIGKRVQLGNDENSVINARVIGLMKDYHQTGLYNVIESLMLLYKENQYMLYAKISPENMPSTISFMEDTWNDLFPDRPFEYSFLDDDIRAQLASDEKRGVIFTFFSVLTVLIACLGLFGLSSFTVAQRTKEVGIRKVMGANEGIIVRLISKEFIILVCFSAVIAIPAAYFYMKNWLLDYIYKADLKWTTFALSTILILLITLITVSYNTIKAARTNPADSLRIE